MWGVVGKKAGGLADARHMDLCKTQDVSQLQSPQEEELAIELHNIPYFRDLVTPVTIIPLRTHFIPLRTH